MMSNEKTNEKILPLINGQSVSDTIVVVAYQVVSATNVIRVQSEVQILLRQNWQPYGPLVSREGIYSQVMVVWENVYLRDDNADKG